VIAKTVQGRPLPGIGSKRHGGGGKTILSSYLQIAIKCPREKKSIIYNYKALPYTISPIANSDLVQWKTNIFSYLFHEILIKFIRHLAIPQTTGYLNVAVPLQMPPITILVSVHHTEAPPLTLQSTKWVSTEPRSSVSTSPEHCLLFFFSPYFFSKLSHMTERKPSLQTPTQPQT